MGISLIPLSEYDTPSIPTDHAIRKVYSTLRNKLLQQDKEPMLTGERLRPATLKLMNQVVDPPASGPYVAELSAALQGWLLSTPSQSLGVVSCRPATLMTSSRAGPRPVATSCWRPRRANS